MAIKYIKSPEKFQHFPSKGAPKCTQIRIFGMKIHRLATLLEKGILV
jgi:hypothetical protein